MRGTARVADGEGECSRAGGYRGRAGNCTGGCIQRQAGRQCAAGQRPGVGRGAAGGRERETIAGSYLAIRQRGSRDRQSA